MPEQPQSGPVRIENGDIVETMYGQGVVVDCVRTIFGYREFVVTIFDTQQIVRLNRLAITKVASMEEFDNEIEMPNLEPMLAALDEDNIDVEPLFPEPMEHQPAAERFATIDNDNDVDDLAEERTAKLTKSQTRWAVRIFRDWLVSSNNGDKLQFEYLPATELADLLRKFYFCVRTKKNKMYSRSAYKSIRAALQRHIESKPYFRKISIATDNEFKEANHVFTGYLARLKREGLDRTSHKPAILPGDVEKLYKHVFTDDPQGLSYRVFYLIVMHMGRRGREGLRELTKDYLVLCTDDQGHEYFDKAYNELDKNHRENKEMDDNEGIIAAREGDPDCPVKHLKDYLAKLHPSCNALFQRPSRGFRRSGQWFDNMPLGKNNLDNYMKKMSDKGHLSKPYTNHCIRRTCVSTLDASGYSTHEIMSVTGHKNVSSLAPYIGKPDMSKKRAISGTLHGYGRQQIQLSQDDFQLPKIRPAIKSKSQCLGSAPRACGALALKSVPQTRGTPRFKQPPAALGAPPTSTEAVDLCATTKSPAHLQLTFEDQSTAFEMDVDTPIAPILALPLEENTASTQAISIVSSEAHNTALNDTSRPEIADAFGTKITLADNSGPTHTLSYLNAAKASDMTCDQSGNVMQNLSEGTQSVDGDVLLTSNTAISVQRRTLGALFAGASISHCNFTININK